jgi:GNAT superfamily N-acetyltransferase
VLRRAAAADVATIAELYERSFATLTYLPVLHTLDEHRTHFARHVAEHETWVWDDGAVRGFMVLSDDVLMFLYLEPAYTGRGIGTSLFEHAKARRPDGFTLWTFQKNVGARRFYERHGLSAIEFGDGSGNEEGVPDVRYEWRPPAGRAPRER